MTIQQAGNKAWPFPTAANHPAAAPSALARVEHPSEDALDHGIEESFPASDPVSVSVSKISPERTSPDLSNSVAGEEDPGASLDLTHAQPGDEAPPETQRTGNAGHREGRLR